MTARLRFAVLGDPVSHSRSPGMHAAAYRALGLPHVYEAVHVTDAGLPGVVEALRRGDFAGLNVTVPHKQRVLALVDAVDPSAGLAGAANTLVRGADGRIVAYNTDTAALAEEIRALAPERSSFEGAAALVLGTGGAARAAVLALARTLRVGDIVVRGRAFADADAGAALRRELEALVARAGSSARVVGEALDEAARRAPAGPGGGPVPTEADFEVIVQATSAGMKGASPGEGVADAVAWDRLPPRAVALEVVYAPPRTPFLARAEDAGVRVANGFGMLARQGALAFELWLGAPAPYNAMLTALV